MRGWSGPSLLHFARLWGQTRLASSKVGCSPSTRRPLICRVPRLCSWPCARFCRPSPIPSCNEAAAFMPLRVERMTTQPAPIGLQRSDGDGAAPQSSAIELTDIFDAVEVPIVVIRRDFTVALFNQAAAIVLGFAPTHIGLPPCE